MKGYQSDPILSFDPKMQAEMASTFAGDLRKHGMGSLRLFRSSYSLHNRKITPDTHQGHD
jgi:hypothetical protein